MQEWTLTSASVRFWFYKLLYAFVFVHCVYSWRHPWFFVAFNYRTKPKGWFGITGLCPNVLLKRKVESIPVILFFCLCNSLFLFVFSSSFMVLLLTDFKMCSLPWQGLKAGTKKQKYERISEKKVSTSIEAFYVQIFFLWALWFLIMILTHIFLF